MTLRVDKISKLLGNKWALRDITFDVAGGEVFGIFGGTGSGKSTLLKCLAGREKTNGGAVYVNDADPSKSGDIFTAGSQKGGLGSLFSRSDPAASDGETKIGEVRAVLDSGKTVLILDEPFAAIDAREREGLTRDIRDAAKSGKIVIISSSDFEHIASSCDRIAVLVNGEIHQIDTPQHVYEHPASSQVAAAAGRNNLFAARRLSSTNADLPEFMSIDGGHRLFAQATDKNRLGAINQNVTLAIRPEQLAISFGASFPEDNLLKAVVTGIRFHGETTLIELDAAGLKLEARVFRVVGLELGEECMIGMPPDRLQVLKD